MRWTGWGWTILGRRHKSDVAEKLQQKIAELDNPQRNFEYQYQRTIGLTSVPKHAPKSAKVLAESQPWTGEESPIDASSRMLQDAIKPMKVTRTKRLSDARENVLDYQLNAAEGPTHKERLVSTKKPRRTGASSGLSSGGWIESVAAQEIENAVKRGQFNDIARGQQAMDSKEGLIASSRNPQLDFTEYLMNNIIKKQGGAPPWIMKQIAVREATEKFREGIRRSLQERLVHKCVAAAKNNSKLAISMALSGEHTKDEDWETQYEKYHHEMVDQLNRKIRGYNLQAPATARKGYLNHSEELRICYDNVLSGIENKIAAFVGDTSIHKANRKQLHSAMPPVESSDKHYGLRQLIRDLFKAKK